MGLKGLSVANKPPTVSLPSSHQLRKSANHVGKSVDQHIFVTWERDTSKYCAQNLRFWPTFLKKFKFYLLVPRNQNISLVNLRLAYTSNDWNQKLLYNCCPKIFLSAYIHSLTVRRAKSTARYHYIKYSNEKYEHKLPIKLNTSKISQWYKFLLTSPTFWRLPQVIGYLSTIFKNNKKVWNVC